MPAPPPPDAQPPAGAAATSAAGGGEPGAEDEDEEEGGGATGGGGSGSGDEFSFKAAPPQLPPALEIPIVDTPLGLGPDALYRLLFGEGSTFMAAHWAAEVSGMRRLCVQPHVVTWFLNSAHGIP